VFWQYAADHKSITRPKRLPIEDFFRFFLLSYDVEYRIRV